MHIPDETAYNKAKVLHTQLDAETKKSFVRSEAADTFGSLFDGIEASDTKKEIQSAAAPLLAELKNEYDRAVSKIEFSKQPPKPVDPPKKKDDDDKPVVQKTYKSMRQRVPG